MNANGIVIQILVTYNGFHSDFVKFSCHIGSLFATVDTWVERTLKFLTNESTEKRRKLKKETPVVHCIRG